MNNRILVKIPDGKLLYEGRMDPLLCGKCKAFLPVSMVREKGGSWLCFQTDSYKKLSSLEKLTAFELLDVIGKVMQNIKFCREYLYYPKDYILSPETVFCSDDKGKVRFLYLPSDRKISDVNAMKNFCYQLRPLTSENGRMYLETLDHLFSVESLNEIRVQGFLNELMTEAYICGVE